MDFAEYLVFKMTSPIITWQGMEDIPTKEMLDRIRLEKIAKLENDKKATDYEAMIYLHTASLATPFSRTWFNIYTNLFHKFYGDKSPLPKPEPLNEQEKRELERFKEWMYKQQIKRFKERMRKQK